MRERCQSLHAPSCWLKADSGQSEEDTDTDGEGRGSGTRRLHTRQCHGDDAVDAEEGHIVVLCMCVRGWIVSHSGGCPQANLGKNRRSCSAQGTSQRDRRTGPQEQQSRARGAEEGTGTGEQDANDPIRRDRRKEAGTVPGASSLPGASPLRQIAVSVPQKTAPCGGSLICVHARAREECLVWCRSELNPWSLFRCPFLLLVSRSDSAAACKGRLVACTRRHTEAQRFSAKVPTDCAQWRKEPSVGPQLRRWGTGRIQ